jgi:hypothetical protein
MLPLIVPYLEPEQGVTAFAAGFAMKNLMQKQSPGHQPGLKTGTERGLPNVSMIVPSENLSRCFL